MIEKDPILKGMANVALSMFTLSEKLKGSESFWGPYLDILPNSYTTALYFSEQDMECLKGSVSFEDAVKQFSQFFKCEKSFKTF